MYGQTRKPPSFIFGGNTGKSLAEIRQGQAQARQALSQASSATPRNVGEGLSAIGRSIAAGLQGRAANKQADAYAQKQNDYNQNYQNLMASTNQNGMTPENMNGMYSAMGSQHASAIQRVMLQQMMNRHYQKQDTADNRAYQQGLTADNRAYQQDVTNAANNHAQTMQQNQFGNAQLMQQQGQDFTAGQNAQKPFKGADGYWYYPDGSRVLPDVQIDQNANVDYGLTPQYAHDANGNLVLVQVNNRGKAVQTQIPEGLSIAKPLKGVDTGTGIHLVNRYTGEAVQHYDNNIANAAAQKVLGKSQGEAQANLGSVIDSGNNMLSVINQALAHEGLHGAVGGLDGLWPDSAMAVYDKDQGDFRAFHNQIKGGAFLKAFESLKGGGTITEIEGLKAEQAIARLSLSQSEDAYKQALRDLQSIVQTGMDRERTKASGGVQSRQMQPPAAEGQRIYTMEEYERLYGNQ